MFSFRYQIINYVLIFFAVLVFWWVVSLGFGRAKNQEQALVIIKNAQSLRQGLEFFYSDFDRFPQNSEFVNALSMLPYFSSFPPEDFIGNGCPTSFAFTRISLKSYELNFCLPASSNDFGKGWNKLTVSK